MYEIAYLRNTRREPIVDVAKSASTREEASFPGGQKDSIAQSRFGEYRETSTTLEADLACARGRPDTMGRQLPGGAGMIYIAYVSKKNTVKPRSCKRGQLFVSRLAAAGAAWGACAGAPHPLVAMPRPTGGSWRCSVAARCKASDSALDDFDCLLHFRIFNREEHCKRFGSHPTDDHWLFGDTPVYSLKRQGIPRIKGKEDRMDTVWTLCGHSTLSWTSGDLSHGAKYLKNAKSCLAVKKGQFSFHSSHVTFLRD